MKKNILKIGILLVILSSLSSCATLFAGGNPKIFIDGTIDEPVTITTEKNIYSNVTLPYMVEVNRHKINGQRISIKSENHQYKDIILEKAVNGWTFANILIGGIIGWAIDMGTNCVSKPAQNHFYIQEQTIKNSKSGDIIKEEKIKK